MPKSGKNGEKPGAGRGLVYSSLFIASDLPAALLAWLFVVLPGPKDLEDSFALDLLLEPPQSLL